MITPVQFTSLLRTQNPTMAGLKTGEKMLLLKMRERISNLSQEFHDAFFSLLEGIDPDSLKTFLENFLSLPKEKTVRIIAFLTTGELDESLGNLLENSSAFQEVVDIEFSSHYNSIDNPEAALQRAREYLQSEEHRDFKRWLKGE